MAFAKREKIVPRSHPPPQDGGCRKAQSAPALLEESRVSFQAIASSEQQRTPPSPGFLRCHGFLWDASSPLPAAFRKDKGRPRIFGAPPLALAGVAVV